VAGPQGGRSERFGAAVGDVVVVRPARAAMGGACGPASRAARGAGSRWP